MARRNQERRCCRCHRRLFLWAYTSFLPSFEGRFILSDYAIENGLFGFWLLKPQALFGVMFEDPLIHAFIWSLAAIAPYS